MRLFDAVLNQLKSGAGVIGLAQDDLADQSACRLTYLKKGGDRGRAVGRDCGLYLLAEMFELLLQLNQPGEISFVGENSGFGDGVDEFFDAHWQFPCLSMSNMDDPPGRGSVPTSACRSDWLSVIQAGARFLPQRSVQVTHALWPDDKGGPRRTIDMSEPESPSRADTTPNHEASKEALADLERLILRGREILAVCGWNGEGYDAFRPGGIWVLKFRSQSLASVAQIFGTESRVHESIHDWIEDPRSVDRGYYLPEIVATLQTAYARLCRERLFRAAPALIASFGEDVIEVAETLVNAGDLIGGADRAGDILQRLLGRLSRQHFGDSETTPAPEEIADRLHEAGILNATEHLRAGACLQISRDLHGERAALIPLGELRDMVHWISVQTRRFRTSG